jgi:hypothetical protein
MDRNAGAVIHVWIFDPPHAAAIRPIGTLSVFWSSRAKYRQRAEKSGTVMGDAFNHFTGLENSY